MLSALEIFNIFFLREIAIIYNFATLKNVTKVEYWLAWQSLCFMRRIKTALVPFPVRD